jgi:hypothetical protein
MKVRAPFHVGVDYYQNWILFTLRAELAWIDKVMWDYFQSQRLATQADRLRLQHEQEMWKKRHRRRTARKMPKN